MDLRLLGPVDAHVNGRPVELGAPKQRAVLAMLALRAGRTVSADRLVEGLWGEQPPASAPKMVQLYVSQLRRVLDGNGAQIVTHGRGYELRLTAGEVDAIQFERLLEQDRAREALDLWRGEALTDLADEPFAAAEIRRLDELRLRATELAIDADLAAGRHREVIGELEALVAEHPLRERLHSQRMLALYRSGRQSEALDAYRDAREVLVEHIGVEPGAELQQLQRAILAHDPALELPSPPVEPPTPAPHPTRRRAPIIAIAGLLLFAGVIAFGISRVTGPESLARIDEDAVGVIDPDSGRITAQYRVGHGPEAVAAGAGSVWVANRLDGTVARIDRGRGEIVTIDVGGAPTGLAFGAGSVWVADDQGRTVAQIDPGVNKVVQRFEVGNAAHAVAVGFGAVWVASAVDATVVRIGLADGEVSRPIAVGARPTALAAGAGAIWVASDDTASVVRVDPRSRRALARIAVGNGPSSIAVGAGAVWVANRADGNVSRIDPTTEQVTEAVRVGREPRAVAADDRGVWVANAGDGTLARIDPQSVQVDERVQVRSSPVALAVVDGEVWSAALAAASTHRGGTLRVAGGPNSLDPADLNPDLQLLYDGLVGYRRTGGSAGGTLVPGLARSLPEPSPDGRTYVFRLRPNLRFSTGAPVRAADVRASLERMLRAPYAAPAEVPPIEGAAGCSPARCDLSEGIEIDPATGTVTIHLSRPDPEFLHKLQIALVVPAGSRPKATTQPLPGTGPYTTERWDPKRGGLLVRNPHFRVWSPDRPDGFPDRIAMRLEPPQIPAMERGAADIAVVYDETGDAAQLRTKYGARLHADARPETRYVWLNVHAPPFDDVRVRQALNYAVDRRRVAELLGAPEAYKPTCQLLPAGFEGHTPSCPFTVNPSGAGIWTGPDLATARRLVAASGTRGMKVEFWGGRQWESLGLYFRSLLRRLGYRAELRTFDDFIRILGAAAREGRRAQLGLWGWIAAAGGPRTYLQSLVSCSAGQENLSRLCDPRLDALMERAAAASGAEAVELWQRVEAMLAATAPTVPLVNPSSIVLTAERVGNYQHHPLWGPLLDQLWVE